MYVLGAKEKNTLKAPKGSLGKLEDLREKGRASHAHREGENPQIRKLENHRKRTKKMRAGNATRDATRKGRGEENRKVNLA